MENKNKLEISKYTRVLCNGEECIVGNIAFDGRWIKMPYCLYKSLKQKIQDNSCCFSEDESKYLKAFSEIGVCIDNPQKDTLQLYPSDVTLEITTQCNLFCKHCSYSFGGKEYSEMPFELITAITKWSESKNIKRILLTGGEPFCRKDIANICEIIKENFSGLLEIITNGTLITDELIDIIVKYVHTLHISLDGYDEKSVSEIRGKGVYTKVVNLINQLHNRGYERITLSYVSTHKDSDSIKNFKVLSEQLHTKPIIRQLNLKGRAKENFTDDPSESELLENLTQKGLTFKCLCNHQYHSIFVNTNAKVFSCAALREEELEIGRFLSSESTININNSFSAPIVDKIEPCKNCKVRYFCADTCISRNNVIYLNNKKRICRCHQRQKLLEQLAWHD